MSIHLTIKSKNRPNLRTAMLKKNLFLVVVAGETTCFMVGNKGSLSWGEKLSDTGSVKQTTYIMHIFVTQFIFNKLSLVWPRVMCWEWKEQLMQQSICIWTPSNVGDETGRSTSDGEKSWQSTQSNSEKNGIWG